MICAYLLFSGLQKSADEALAWYDEKRTKDRKGVTIPSQRRYVQYFSKLVCSSVPYSKISLNVSISRKSYQLSYNEVNFFLFIFLGMWNTVLGVRFSAKLRHGKMFSICITRLSHRKCKARCKSITSNNLRREKLFNSGLCIFQRLKTWTIDFQKSFILTSKPSLPVSGDIKFELKQKSSKKIVCHFWLNTFFVRNYSREYN